MSIKVLNLPQIIICRNRIENVYDKFSNTVRKTGTQWKIIVTISLVAVSFVLPIVGTLHKLIKRRIQLILKSYKETTESLWAEFLQPLLKNNLCSNETHARDKSGVNPIWIRNPCTLIQLKAYSSHYCAFFVGL
jgi:hypothetical protein